MRKAIGATALIACLVPIGARAQAIGRINIFEASTTGDPEMIRRSSLGDDTRDWTTPADYPAAARAEKRAGEVLVDVSVTAGDKVSDCRSASPDAPADMQAAACAIVRARGKFRHALAADGTAQPGTLRLHVYFYFSEGGYGPAPMMTTPFPPPPGSTRAEPVDSSQFQLRDLPAGATKQHVGVSLDISAKGEVTRCRIEDFSGADAVDAAICRQLSRARFNPARDASRAAVAEKHFFIRAALSR